MSLAVASCRSSKSGCDAYGIKWENPGIDSLSVVKGDKTYLPFIPVKHAMEFHISYAERGRYIIFLKDGDVIVEEKSFVLK
jgi:hypothetical protein